MSTDTLKISNGPWDAGTAIVNAVTGEGENFSDGDIWIFPTDDAGPVAICHKPGDAILIADAGTTFNRTGKTPSQLAERLEVLRNDLEWALTWINNEAKHLRKRGQPQPALELLLEMVKTRHGIDLSTPPTNVK